jgi:hypothetical protein
MSCSLCNATIVDTRHSTTQYPCGHTFHATCVAPFITGGYSECLLCAPVERGGLFGNFTSNRISGTPFNSGSDIRIDKFNEERLLLLQRAGSTRIENIGKTLSRKTATTNSGVAVADANSGVGPGAALIVFMNRLLDFSASGSTGSTPDEIIVDRGNPLILIENRMRSFELVDLGYEASDLVRQNVTLHKLIENGYNIGDLIILNATWDILLALGLRNYVTFRHMRTKHNEAAAASASEDGHIKTSQSVVDSSFVAILVNVYGIKFADVFTRVCGESIAVFGKLGLSVEEMKSLGVDILLLLKSGITKNIILESYSHLTLDDWYNLGMDIEHMRELNINAGVVSQEFGKRLQFTDDTFKKLYNCSITDALA